MEGTLTLREAANNLGVRRRLLKKMIRDGSLPEARKIQLDKGPAWVIPEAVMSELKTRDDIVLDLRGKTPKISFIETPETNVANSPLKAESEFAEIASNLDSESELGQELPEGVGPQLMGSSRVDSNLIQFRKQVAKEIDDNRAANGANSKSSDTISSVGSLLPRRADSTPAEWSGKSVSSNGGRTPTPKQAEALDLALLDRLLGIQAEKAAVAAKATHDLETLKQLSKTHDLTREELAVEKRERSITADRFREERLARAVADAKVAELRDRISKEAEQVKSEKQARDAALAKRIQAERDAATAVASMGWISRRRYQRLIEDTNQQS